MGLVQIKTCAETVSQTPMLASTLSPAALYAWVFPMCHSLVSPFNYLNLEIFAVTTHIYFKITGLIKKKGSLTKQEKKHLPSTRVLSPDYILESYRELKQHRHLSSIPEIHIKTAECEASPGPSDD